MKSPTAPPNFHDEEEFWQYVGDVLRRRLRLIQCQGNHWKGHPDHVADVVAQDQMVTRTHAELVRELQTATDLIEKEGYPQTVSKGRLLRDMVALGDVRQHEIRAAIAAYQHLFHPASDMKLW